MIDGPRQLRHHGGGNHSFLLSLFNNEEQYIYIYVYLFIYIYIQDAREDGPGELRRHRGGHQFFLIYTYLFINENPPKYIYSCIDVCMYI